MDILKDLSYGSITGLVTTIVFEYGKKFFRTFRKWKFKRLLGHDADREGSFSIIYGKFETPQIYDKNGEEVEYPFIKPAHDNNRISISNPVSDCEIRASNYLSTSLLRAFGGNPKIVPDTDFRDFLTTSIISLGGPRSNTITKQILNDKSNCFIKQLDDRFLTIDDKQLKAYEKDADYGIILRTRSEKHPDRVWVVCSGLGEWGTSGTAWYLTNRYKVLLKRNNKWYNPLGFGNNKNFVALIRVPKGHDDLAELICFWNDGTGMMKYYEKETKYTASISLDKNVDSRIQKGSGSAGPLEYSSEKENNIEKPRHLGVSGTSGTYKNINSK